MSLSKKIVNALLFLFIASGKALAADAIDDFATTSAGQPVTINVLANDTFNSCCDSLGLATIDTEINGTVVRSGDAFIYTPDDGFIGDDIFSYAITTSSDDGIATITDLATVTISVTGEVPPIEPPSSSNKDPVALIDSVRVDNTNPTSVTIDVLANDSDPDDDTLSLVHVDQPDNGSAAISGNQVVYTPNSGYIGIEIFFYEISDGNGGKDKSFLTIEVYSSTSNNKPIAVDDEISIEEGSSDVSIDVLANDIDPDGDSLIITDVIQGDNGVATVVNNKIIYTPDSGFSGNDSLIYWVSDGGDV
ncbi:MAG: Ig-like domain-containing protein, partial [Thiolinea sp.]